MTNREIINYIDRYCAQKEYLDIYINPGLAFAILAHGYLYMRPDNVSEQFVQGVIKAFESGALAGFDDYLKSCGILLDEAIYLSMASAALQVAREMFDKEYFEEQSASLDPEEECDSTLLDKYLNLMNKEQLRGFMDDISCGSGNYLAFSDFDLWFEINNELNERCRKVNPLIPERPSDEHRLFHQRNPYYMFDYLSKEEIVDAIKRGIVFNKSLAGHLARMTYNNISTGFMDYYIELISTYERVFGRDIYNPDILL